MKSRRMGDRALSVIVAFHIIVLGMPRETLAVPAPQFASEPGESPVASEPAAPNPSRTPTTKERYIACAKVGLGVVVLWTILRNFFAVAKATGKTGSVWNQTVADLINFDKETLVGIEMLFSALGIVFTPSSIIKKSIQNFWDEYCMPAIRECGLTDLTSDLNTILSPPPLWMPKPSDMPGIRTGRYCYGMAKDNLYTWGWKNCLKSCNSCCDGHLTAYNKRLDDRDACYAVCKTGLTPYNPWN